jgi:hypothetical protein
MVHKKNPQQIKPGRGSPTNFNHGEQEETHWMQRSRANWLRHGDRNTSFFHHYATERTKKNFIKKLKNDQEEWFEGTD